ncbi:MAG: hypothetical protein K6L80_07375 [Agarilytica sp.]
MKYLIIAIFFISPVLLADGRTLNKALITSFYAVTEKIERLEDKYPTIFSQTDNYSMADQDKAIRLMEKSSAYPEVMKALSSSEFKSLAEVYDVSTRLMGGMFFVQMKKMPAGMDFDAMEKTLENSIKSMKDSGAPAAMIAGLEETLNENRAQSKDMAFAMAKASEADKKFIADNIDWLMSIIPDDGGEGSFDGAY